MASFKQDLFPLILFSFFFFFLSLCTFWLIKEQGSERYINLQLTQIAFHVDSLACEIQCEGTSGEILTSWTVNIY